MPECEHPYGGACWLCSDASPVFRAARIAAALGGDPPRPPPRNPTLYVRVGPKLLHRQAVRQRRRVLWRREIEDVAKRAASLAAERRLEQHHRLKDTYRALPLVASRP